MIVWENNPFEDVIKVTESLFGEQQCSIVFNPKLYKNEKAYGATTFLDNGNVVIELDAESSISTLIEILAHELAHVVVGEKHEHDNVWEKCFDDIANAFGKYCENKYLTKATEETE